MKKLTIKTKPKIQVNSTTTDPLISFQQAADRLGVTVRTMHRYVASDLLPAPIRIGGRNKYRKSDIENFIERAEKNRG